MLYLSIEQFRARAFQTNWFDSDVVKAACLTEVFIVVQLTLLVVPVITLLVGFISHHVQMMRRTW